MIIIPAVLMGKVYKMQGQLGHVSREVETTGKKIFKKEKEMVEILNMVIETKKAFEEVISKLETTKEK